ncbi:MAG: dihydrolipoyl dehydrogenase family protein, partial [Solirubrobacterales bacterium]
MTKRYDLVILGGGTAGIVASQYGAETGARVALVEPGRIGGDCLYTGCVPSKALLAAGERAHAIRTAGRLGIEAGEPRVDFGAVMGHLAEAQRKAGAEDTPEYLRSLGVADVIEAAGRFTSPGQIEAGGRTLHYRTAIIATGSQATMPPIEGLDRANPLTNETLFELEQLPDRLLILGGGPIGCEMAQAFGRLGAQVCLVEAADRLLPGEEPEVGALLAQVFAEEGVEVHASTTLERVEPGSGGGGRAILAGGEAREFDRILVATGRRGVSEELGLDAVGVAVDEASYVRVDERLRTTGDRIFAAGDVTGGLQFTHNAAYQALTAMGNALFRARQSTETNWVPWTTFTDPEVAHVGMTEERAREMHGEGVEIYTHDYAENDRAITTGNDRGFVKLIAVGLRQKLVGATICGPAAGESIGEAARLVRDGGTVANLSQM